MSRKLLIGFYASGLPFHGHTINEASLGGSETAVLYIARELAARGHDVKVFNNCPKPGRYDDVDYFDYQKSWREVSPLVEWDVFISSRDFTFLSQRMNHRLCGLWNHDIATDGKALMTNAWAPDFMWCLSDFHTQQYLSKAPQLKPLIYKTRNGVDLRFIDSVRARATQTRAKNLFVYGSRPERGLDTLLTHTWPKILKEVDSKAVLLIAGYSDKGIELPEHIIEYHKYIDELVLKTPNVERVGTLSKEKWYELLCSTGMLIYPTRFPEISCILAMEAQACGLPVITSNEFALAETVGDKANLISHHPNSEEYQNAFVARVKKLYNNDTEYKLTQKRGRNHIEGTYEWNIIAEEWENFFWEKFETRSLKNGGKNVLRQMIYRSDLLAAKWALDNSDKTGVNVESCAELKKDIDNWINTHDEDPEEYNVYTQEERDLIDNKWSSKEINVRFSIAISHVKTYVEANLGKKPFTLVDVGCGYGIFLAQALKAFPNQVSVMGIDFSTGLIESASQFLTKFFPTIGNPKDFMIAADFMQLPIPSDDEKADVIFAGEWLEHQLNVTGALERLQAWVKPGGLVVITIPSGPWEAVTLQVKPNEPRHHVSHFEFRDIEELFAHKQFNMEFHMQDISPIDHSLLGNWIISFKADSQPFGTIDYLRKFRTLRPYQYVSASLIMKNEEDNVLKCLKSLRFHVDELIVVDTGSSDASIELAKKYATKVVQIPWPEDFSEARNIAASYASSDADWLLWQDFDEQLLGGNQLRKYLNSELFNGYVITQNHVTLDMQGVKPDVPVRIYRNNAGIKFYGAIHEHCEMGLDRPIDPVLILPDVKVLHYGYLTEAIRRSKCRDRNLALLVKDREKYPNRQLGIVLMMRDYLNISQWEIEASRGKITDTIIKYLQEVVRLHRQYFADESHLYHELSYTLYQRALAFLGNHGVPAFSNSELIPFEIRLGLGGAVGGMRDPESVRPNSYWFADRAEFQKYVETLSDRLSDTLKLPEVSKKRK